MKKILITEEQEKLLNNPNIIMLPDHIIKRIDDRSHSLGVHPSFPPDDEEKFEKKILNKTFIELKNKINEMGIDNKDIKTELNNLLLECQSLEENIKDELEIICYKFIDKLFTITNSNNIKIDCHLTDNIESQSIYSGDKNNEFQFNNIKHINVLNNHIYKRRLLNALMEGISKEYLNKFEYYITDIFKLNPKLPELYNKIITLYDYYLFINKTNNNIKLGCGDVIIDNNSNNIIIDVKGKIFPSLLYEAIKGIFQLISLHGLPLDKNETQYILSKSDLEEFNSWDKLLGTSLWEIISNGFNNDIKNEYYIPYYYMSLIIKEPKEFHKLLKELFANTKLGKDNLNELLHDIKIELDVENFNDIIKNKNKDYNINDYFFNQ
jgi:hypothetical protein